MKNEYTRIFICCLVAAIIGAITLKVQGGYLPAIYMIVLGNFAIELRKSWK